MNKKIIAIDAMGGDKAPKSVIAGLAISAIRNPNFKYLIFGDKTKIAPLIKRRTNLIAASEIIHTEDWVRNDEKASIALRRSKDTSMGQAIKSVSEGNSDAIVSGGNSGALMAMSIFGLKRITGISRPALAAIMPTINGELLALDLGANVDCTSQNLIDFSVMGIVFAQQVLGKPYPKFSFLNVGEEQNKGKTVIHEAAEVIESGYFNKFYNGYIEGNNIVKGNVDVVVCDGFSGNIMLKTAEGTAKLCAEYLKQVFNSSFLGKFSYLIGRSSFLGIRKKMDPRKHNGAVLLGLNGIVVKSHGGTDSIGFAHAVDLASEMTSGNYIEVIKEHMTKLKKI